MIACTCFSILRKVDQKCSVELHTLHANTGSSALKRLQYAETSVGICYYQHGLSPNVFTEAMLCSIC